MKIPKAVQEPTGMWYIRLRVRNAEGEMMSYAIREETEKKAVDKALALKAGLKAETVEAKRKLPDKTLRQAIDEYIAKRSVVVNGSPLRSPVTIRGYRYIQNHRFQGVMDEPLGSVKDWEAVLREEMMTCSGKTVKNAWSLVGSVYKENGLTLTPVINKPSGTKKKREIKWLDYDEIPVFLDAIKGSKYEVGALLALHSMRRSEIFGLTWENVNLKKEVITVKGALVPDEHNKYVLKKENKTAASQRPIIIVIPRLAELLKETKERDGFVMTCGPGALYRNINKACESVGLTKVGIHGLRHTFASLCYHLNVPELETVRRGGWKDSKVVHDIYTHLAARDIMSVDQKLRKFYITAEKCQAKMPTSKKPSDTKVFAARIEGSNPSVSTISPP